MSVRPAAWILPLLIAAISHPTAWAQNFPAKPVRIIAPEAGGGADLVARIVAQKLTDNLGQQVIVDNRKGGVVPGEIVARAAPDGYTLLFIGGTFTVAPLMQQTPYDVTRDFSTITLAVQSPAILAVHPAVAAASVRDLIGIARAKPGTLNYASAATGSSSHLAAELFKSMAQVNIVRIPYKGNGPALNALLANQVQVMFAAGGVTTPHVKAGRLRALGVTSAQPSALFPDLPTITSAGVIGYEATVMLGYFAPARTPLALINRLNREIVEALRGAEVRARLFDAGFEVIGSSPLEFSAAIKADTARLSKVIREAGIRAE